MPKTLTLTTEEVALLVALVANLDPAKYPNDEAKSLIYKAKNTFTNIDKFTHIRVIAG